MSSPNASRPPGRESCRVFLFAASLALGMGCSDTSPYKTASMAVVPREWRAHHPWGPLANDWRDRGWIPYAKYSDVMARRAAFARDTIQDGDLVFRLGGPPCRFTGFDHSAFLAHLSDSSFSHVAIAHHRDGRVSIYDVAKEGVRDIPFEVWMEETRADTFTFAVKRIKPEHRGCIPAVLAYCHKHYLSNTQFDYSFLDDDNKLYCAEIVENAFRTAGVILSDPVPIRCLPNYPKYAWLRVLAECLTEIRVDRRVYAPGNEHYGIWASPYLDLIYLTRTAAAELGTHKPPTDLSRSGRWSK